MAVGMDPNQRIMMALMAQDRAQSAPVEPQPEPMSPGMAAINLLRRRVPQEATAENAGKIGAATVLGPAMGAATGIASRFPLVSSALYGLTHTMPAGSNDADKQGVMNLQRQLKEAGYYQGPIDGVMGGGTAEAKKRFETDNVQKQQLEIERSKAEAAAKGAEAATAETQRKAAEAEATNQRRSQGEERLRQLESEVSPARQVLREYGPIVGTLGGVALGVGGKYGVNKVADALSKSRAAAADDILAAPATDLPGRVGRVNDFWARGQSPMFGGVQAPFVSAPGAKAGFRANPAAPEAANLYQPSKVKNALTDTAAVGAFGADWAAGQTVLEPEARAELEKAQQAVNADPSEVNIERLQVAKDRLAFAETVKNIGRGAAFAYPAAGIKFGRNPSRPNTGAAEAERIRIGQEVKGKGHVAQALMAPVKTGRMRTVAPGVRKSQAGTFHADDGRFVSPPAKK